jgi:uncharacterized protein RhaS with RHS repeats
MCYMRARYYDPAIGRFLTADPLPGSPTSPGTLNRYAYALNNPVNRVDPAGLASEGAVVPLLTPTFYDQLSCLLAVVGGISSALLISQLAAHIGPALLLGHFSPGPTFWILCWSDYH